MCKEQKAVVSYVQELLRVCILPFFFFFLWELFPVVD